MKTLKLLVANRGEIASRIFRTARSMGIKTVAVYHPQDQLLSYVREADEAFLLQGEDLKSTYLNGEQIIALAKATGCWAIHPGYGFLSENAQFAQAVVDAGLVFVGPSAQSIRSIGDKASSKKLLAPTSVPLIPGYYGDDQSLATLKQHALQIGFPLLIKASAGGGGKGMKIVTNEAELESMLAMAKNEARKAFSDDRVMLEKYLPRPRHVEVQVFADQQGNCMIFGTRDCSVQRRHQKVVEEALAPNLPASTLEQLERSAREIVKLIGYYNAGTLEFMVDDQHHCYFLEMNTRLQVEHPVSEIVFQQDFVKLQLLIAQGHSAPWRNSEGLDPLPVGHAIEVRLYAEDPEEDFLPTAGMLHTLTLPQLPGLRYDMTFQSGDEISTLFDPMLGKVIAWGESREQAAERLQRALKLMVLLGPKNNLAFLRSIINSDAFKKAELSTAFLKEWAGELKVRTALTTAEKALLAAVFSQSASSAAPSGFFSAPLQGFRLSGAPVLLPWMLINELPEQWTLKVTANPDQRLLANASTPQDQLIVTAPKSADASSPWLVSGTAMLVAKMPIPFGELYCINGKLAAVLWRYQGKVLTPDQLAATLEGALSIKSPMPGKVVSLLASPGQQVAKGEVLLTLEAMKMEHPLKAPAKGIIKAINAKAGQQVNHGEVLITMETKA